MRILSDFLRTLSRTKNWPKLLFRELSPPQENFWKLTGMTLSPTLGTGYNRQSLPFWDNERV